MAPFFFLGWAVRSGSCDPGCLNQARRHDSPKLGLGFRVQGWPKLQLVSGVMPP